MVRLVDPERAFALCGFGLSMALLLTLCVPPVIPLLIWFGLWRFNANIWWALLITLIGMWLWSILLLLWVSFQ